MVRPLSPKDVLRLALFGPLLGWGWGKGGPDSCGGQSGPSGGQGPSPGTPSPEALSWLSRNDGPRGGGQGTAHSEGENRCSKGMILDVSQTPERQKFSFPHRPQLGWHLQGGEDPSGPKHEQEGHLLESPPHPAPSQTGIHPRPHPPTATMS